jgi:Fur family peroxide stress response transcriptional regulator
MIIKLFCNQKLWKGEPMKPSIEALRQALKEKGVNPSHQRLKVLEYLYLHPIHPTAEEVYAALKPELATLSKTTVYNSLRVLADSDLVRTLNMDGNETRFDLTDIDHGHFKCLSCGAIIDVPMDTRNIVPGMLDGWDVRETDVHFKGVCPECASTSKKEGK